MNRFYKDHVTEAARLLEMCVCVLVMMASRTVSYFLISAKFSINTGLANVKFSFDTFLSTKDKCLEPTGLDFLQLPIVMVRADLQIYCRLMINEIIIWSSLQTNIQLTYFFHHS